MLEANELGRIPLEVGSGIPIAILWSAFVVGIILVIKKREQITEEI